MDAFNAVVVLFLACICYLVSTAASEQNCSVVKCKILPVGENLVPEFKLKASKKGVRMIYLNLEIGNNSYKPLELQDEFLPDRWVWAQSNNEPMLSLPFDFDILSLGLLNYQVRSMTVPLRDEPNGCLAGLNSTCQNMAVGRALLDNVTRDSSHKTGVVCVAMLENIGDTKLLSVKYHCCSSNATHVYCDLCVADSSWFQAIKVFLYCLSVVVLLYCPALLLLLPDFIFSLQCEYDKEDNTRNHIFSVDHARSNAPRGRNGYEEIQNEEESTRSSDTAEIPVDDASPVSCSTFMLGYVQRLPDLRISFNVKLAVLMFCIFPSALYFQVTLFFVLKPKYTQERIIKGPPGTESSTPEFSVLLMNVISPSTIIFLTLLALPYLTAVLFLTPKDLFSNHGCPFCDEDNQNSISSIGDDTLQHLKILRRMAYSFILAFRNQHNRGLIKIVHILTCYSKMNYRGSRMRRALFSIWHIFSSLFTLFLGLVWGVICLFLLLVRLFIVVVTLSPFMMVPLHIYLEIKTKIERVASRISRMLCIFLLFLVFLGYMYLVLLSVTFYLAVFTLCTFFIGILGFSTMGLVLNAEIVIPYVSFLVVVTTNVYLCYANLQRNYVEFKGFILKYLQQHLQATTSSEKSTIPAKLFWFVSYRVFPVSTEICLMFLNMAVIVTFLFLTISSIFFFQNEHEISTLVSTIAVFVSGAIPSLFFKGFTRGKKFTGWKRIKLEREVEKSVREYVQGSGPLGINSENGENMLKRIDHYIV